MVRILQVALVALASSLLYSCGAATPAATPAPTPVPKLSMGQSAQIEGLKIVVDNPRRFPKPNAEEEFLTYYVAAENVGSDTKIVNPNDFYVVDGKGQRRTYDWGPPKEAGNGLRQTYLEPKEKVDGNISFLVPKGDLEVVLTYQQPVAPQVYNPQLASWGLK